MTALCALLLDARLTPRVWHWSALGATLLTPQLDEVTRLVNDDAATYSQVIRNLKLLPE